MTLPRYDWSRSYHWNFQHAPPAASIDVPPVAGSWQYCGLPVDSPLGVPAGPLLNGKWCLYYASLGFDVLTYKTVRAVPWPCYDLPNLQPVDCPPLTGGEQEVAASSQMDGSWAVSFGMPSKAPSDWRADVRWTRDQLPPGKRLSVSVVGTIQDGWTLDQLADDYAQCADWAVDSGADCVEANFSCPNVATCDGQLYQHPQDAGRVTWRIADRVAGRVPLIIKVGRIADAKQGEELLEALDGSANVLAMTNSIATSVRGEDGNLLFDGQRRGICGSATLDASVAQTEMMNGLIVRHGSAMQLIGVGGAASADDVHRYLRAGAHAVHLATAAMINPAVALAIRQQLDPTAAVARAIP